MADEILKRLDALEAKVESRLDGLEAKVDAGFDALAREIRSEHKILVDIQQSSSAHAEHMAEVLEVLRLRRAAG